jgi:L-serine dehydratase
MISVFDIFKIGIGPSSSHTVGPMLGGRAFAVALREKRLLGAVRRVRVDLYGSLALTGEGHGTPRAVLLGLEGNVPESVDIANMAARDAALRENADLRLGGDTPVPFTYARDMRLHKELFLPKHPNAMTLTALDGEGKTLFAETYYSLGGGFIATDETFGRPMTEREQPPYRFGCADELFETCRQEGKTVAEVILVNEVFWHGEAGVAESFRRIYDTMRACVEAGCRNEGVLPGGLGVRRRAPALLRKIISQQASGRREMMLWGMLYAFAVAEENAAGGRMVTAPTNGAAGIIPAVLMFYRNFYPKATDEGVRDFLLTAGAIGIFYKKNASISGAEVCCQGEVGVACSMAAGAYCAVTGGNLKQVEVAAEIAMEHNLGLTCDPVNGLVQIPCIERNAVAAERAISCGQLSVMEDGAERLVTLDQVIYVMYHTGLDMQSKYKETSLGGLATGLQARRTCAY